MEIVLILIPKKHLTANAGVVTTKRILIKPAILLAAIFTADSYLANKSTFICQSCNCIIMKITRQTLDDVIKAFGNIEAEAGGIFGIKNDVICNFYFDENAPHYYQEYHPNIDDLNSKISEWENKGITFAGIIHSHPNGYLQLSKADYECIFFITKSNPQLQQLYFPIITKSNDIVEMAVYRATIEQKKISIKKTSYDVV